MIDYSGTYTDQYQLTMAQVFFLKGQSKHRAVFDYFFRKLPFEGGYAVFSGLEDLLALLTEFRFTPEDLNFLKEQGFHADFIQYLKNFRFQGDLYASREGDVVFPVRPVLTVEANVIEAQVIETVLLNLLNFQTLIATKASRIRQVAKHHELVDFGLRRSQGPGGYYASRAAMVGGFNATSNVRAGRDYGIPVSGTMSHAFVQSYDQELTAFRAFASVWPHQCVLLVDTYDTLNSGLPNAIQIAKELESRGHRLKGIRLDSGDLCDLAKKSRYILDQAGLYEVKIAASNELDEYAIQTLLAQQAPIDLFGVGTSLVIGRPDAVLDGVYKLCSFHNRPRIKLSESLSKTNLPGRKQAYRVFSEEKKFLGMDAVALRDETKLSTLYHPVRNEVFQSVQHGQLEPLLQPVMINGERIHPPKTLDEIAQYSQQRLNLLPNQYKTLDKPEAYQVALSEQLMKKRDELVLQYQPIR